MAGAGCSAGGLLPGGWGIEAGNEKMFLVVGPAVVEPVVSDTASLPGGVVSSPVIFRGEPLLSDRVLRHQPPRRPYVDRQRGAWAAAWERRHHRTLWHQRRHVAPVPPLLGVKRDHGLPVDDMEPVRRVPRLQALSRSDVPVDRLVVYSAARCLGCPILLDMFAS